MGQVNVEAVVTLRHDSGAKPCGAVAVTATASWLGDVIATGQPFQCRGCGNRRMVTLDEVSGEEPYIPEYRQPRGF